MIDVAARAVERAREALPERLWSNRVVVYGDEAMVMPEETVPMVVGDAPAWVTPTGVVALSSNADTWPEWYWQVCEDDSAWVIITQH